MSGANLASITAIWGSPGILAIGAQGAVVPRWGSHRAIAAFDTSLACADNG